MGSEGPWQVESVPTGPGPVSKVFEVSFSGKTLFSNNYPQFGFLELALPWVDFSDHLSVRKSTLKPARLYLGSLFLPVRPLF